MTTYKAKPKRGATFNLDDLYDFERNEQAPFAHPYFWAPFILIGNWQ